KIFTGFEAKLEMMSKEFYKVTQYQEWLARGMNEARYQANDGDWHDSNLIHDLADDRGRMIEGFFCGKRPEDAIRIVKEIHGLPIPFNDYSVSTYTEELLDENPEADASSIQMRGMTVQPYRSLRLP